MDCLGTDRYRRYSILLGSRRYGTAQKGRNRDLTLRGRRDNAAAFFVLACRGRVQTRDDSEGGLATAEADVLDKWHC